MSSSSSSLKVMLVEDNPDDMEFIRRSLPVADFHFDHVELLAEAEELLEQGADKIPDIILLDLNLPDADELEALVKLNELAPEVPIVVLSGLATEGLALRAIQGQAQDYIVKSDLNPRSLSRAIRYAIERKDAEKQRHQTQKMQAVGQLTGGVAHDFNNLLGAMMLNLEFLEPVVAHDERGMESLAAVSQAVKRGAALTQRLLAFSRQQVLQAEVIDLNNLLTEQYDLLRRTMPAHMEIEQHLSDNLWQTNADSNQLENALLNLAINARDAMPEGGRLIIETSNVTVDRFFAAQEGFSLGDYVKLSVGDTGTGMSAEVRDRVLEPFFTTKEQGRGTGLGLSMVYGFVEQSGGHLKLLSEEGLGTTIEMYFPRSLPNVGAAADVPATEQVEIVSGHQHILVVEDNIDIQSAVVRSLVKLGYQVSAATSGPEAIAWMDNRIGGLDLLLTDMILPEGVAGPEIAKEAVRRFPECVAVYMSGYSDMDVSGLGKDDGEVHYMSKPFAMASIADKVREALAERLIH